MGVINLGAIVEKLRKKLSADFISKTDYPSGSDAGVIKVDSTYATAVTTGGKLKATEITAEAYSEANDAAFISKATLDNVLAAQPSGGVTLEKIYDKIPTYPATAAEDASVSGKTFAGYTAYIVGMEGASSNITDFGSTIPYEVVHDGKAVVTVDSTAITFELNGTFDKMWITTAAQLTKKLRIWGVK